MAWVLYLLRCRGCLGFADSLTIGEFKTQEQEFKAQEEKRHWPEWSVIKVNQDLSNKGASMWRGWAGTADLKRPSEMDPWAILA